MLLPENTKLTLDWHIREKMLHSKKWHFRAILKSQSLFLLNFFHCEHTEKIYLNKFYVKQVFRLLLNKWKNLFLFIILKVIYVLPLTDKISIQQQKTLNLRNKSVYGMSFKISHLGKNAHHVKWSEIKQINWVIFLSQTQIEFLS